MVKSYKISGMTCKACTDIVTSLLSKVDGVSKVNVSLSDSRSEVEMKYDIAFETLQAAFSDSLYKISEGGMTEGQTRRPVPVDDVLERNKELVSGYVSAVGKLEYERLQDFIHPDFKYTGDVNFESAADYIKMIKDHAASPVANVLVQNKIEAIYADQRECCVIYELVTIFPGRTVPFVEWLTIEGGRILSANVKFNHLRMKQLMEEMNRVNAVSS